MEQIDKIYNQDCFIGMQGIADGTVDCIITDPPYGITGNKWDVQIDIDRLFAQFWRVLKPNGALLVFGMEPFASRMRLASGHFRYDWIWDKRAPVGFLDANKRPLRRHEVITVHYRHLPTYNPQFTEGKPYKKKSYSWTAATYRCKQNLAKVNDGTRYPVSIICFPRPMKVNDKNDSGIFHPTQKPIELLEYFVKTYTNPGDLILDPFMGSGTTAAACINAGRHYLGYELDSEYYTKSLVRIQALKKSEV